MKNRLTHNIGLKLISLAISMLMWGAVTSASDPAVSQSFYNVPVVLLNADVITDSNQVFEILEDSALLQKVTVKAPRSVIVDIDADDIMATADVSDLSSLDTISINLSTKKHQDQIISIKGSKDTVKLKIENTTSKTLALSTDIKNAPADGYIQGNVTTAQNLVKISGGESLVNSVTRAVAEIDISGFTEKIDTAAEIKLYDAEGNEVPSDKLTLNMHVVGITIDILKKKELPIKFEYEGEPAPGYAATGVIESDRQVALICGDKELVEEIDLLTIPKEAIDIDGQKNNYTLEVDISKYLPHGISVVDDAGSIYTVTVYILPEVSKHISISTSDISVINIPDGYNVTVAIDEGTIVDLVGLSDDLSPLNKDNIKPVVDVKSWLDKHGEIEEGFYTIDVSFQLPGSVRVVDSVKATVHIVKKE